MSFIHEESAFPDLLAIVQRRLSEKGLALSEALVEKDYWVTHTLWSLQQLGLEVWFKGGTSLSKGFGLIQRFSEDLDLKLQGGAGVFPGVSNWKSDKPSRIVERKIFFEALAQLQIPDLTLRLNPESLGEKCRNVEIEAVYPGLHLATLAQTMKPFVLLEIGDARVRPFVDRPISSFVHDFLQDARQLEAYRNNRPTLVHCIHPLATLIEKLDAISRRFEGGKEASGFVRHYEDAAHIIQKAADLPQLSGYENPTRLIQEMLAEKQIRKTPCKDDSAFSPDNSSRWNEIQVAHQAIGGMFWGPRLGLPIAAEIIRDWIASV